MRIVVYLCFVAMCTLACKESAEKRENKDRLSTDLVNNPRSATGTDTAALNALATMDFRDTVHYFGTIRAGERISHDFEFTNNGKNPLIISSASASCGCTVPDYPREPVAPGQSGAVKVQFNSTGREGYQEKSVTLITNSIRGTHTLYIKGEVKN